MKKLCAILLTLCACAEVSLDLLDRNKFENVWWEIQEYPICFNFHETGELLTYEGNITSQGEWDFYTPNSYLVQDYTFIINEYESCWEITGYVDQTITACECTIF